MHETALFPPASAGEAGPVAIRYSLAASVKSAELAIFDVAGRRVSTLARGQQGAGSYSVQWDRRDERGRQVGRGVRSA